MSVELRLLRPEDANILSSVPPGVFDDAIDAAAARSFLGDPRHHIVVALDGGVVVGFVSALHYAHPDKPAPELWINEVGVAGSHQRRGIATQLMQVMFDHARALGCAEAWVLTERDNAAAMRLYGAVGGAPSDSVMFTFPLSS